MDLLPRVIPADEWATIEAGLIQRVTALNRFLDDLYVGERAAIHDGIVPRWLRHVLATGFVREAARHPGAQRRPLPGGRHRPRPRRRRHLPRARGQPPQPERHQLRAREPGGDDPGAASAPSPTTGCAPSTTTARALLDALRHVAPPSAGDDPTVVVLTPGVFNSAYFEHAFLARQMGVELVEGRDLVVDEHVVSMRTTRGLAARRRHLPAHRRRLPRPGRVPAPTRRSACPASWPRPAAATSPSPTPSATAWPTTRPSTPTCPSSSATTSARSRSCPTSRPTCCGTPTSGPPSSTASTSWW